MTEKRIDSQLWVGSVMILHGHDPAILKRYTYKPLVPHGAPSYVKAAPIKLATRHRDYTIFPRDLSLLETHSFEEIQDRQRPKCPDPDPTRFQGSLDVTRSQPEAVSKVMKQLTKSPYGGGAILSLPVGYGKTVCALYIAANVAKRVLVLVHTRILATQWIERVQTYLPGIECHHVTSEAFDAFMERNPPTDRKPLYVVMLMQTLLARQKDISETFDLVIVDETHHLAAPTLSKSMELAGCRYRLGLSATLERKDGLHVLLEHVLGPCAFRMHRDVPTRLQLHAYPYRRLVGLNSPTVVEAITNSANDPQRNQYLVKIIKTWYEKGRYVVVMSDRRAQLDLLGRLLHDKHIPCVWAVGGTAQSPDVSARPVVLATYAYCAEGMDIAALDTCVLATSRCEIRQCVGRILRRADHDPVICDVIDMSDKMLLRQYHKRRRWLESPLDQGGMAAQTQTHEVMHDMSSR